MKNDLSFDVLVIGGGHAGCEAAAAGLARGAGDAARGVGGRGGRGARRGAHRGKMPRPWQPGFPRQGQGSFWVKKLRKNKSSQNGILYRGKA